MRLFALLASLLLSVPQSPGQQPQASDWPEYGGTLAGQRYSPEKQVDPGNVTRLQVAWTLHTHTLETPSPLNSSASFEATPVLWHDTLYFDTPFDEIFAADAATGRVLWSFDPHVRRKNLYIIASRGVALWHAKHPARGVCGSDAVLVATLDRRLIKVDALSGQRCPRFGHGGSVDLTKGVSLANHSLYFFTSGPTVVGDRIVLGSSVADNQQLFAGSGAVRGFDAVSGRQVWSWEPLPWNAEHRIKHSGSGNAWTPLAADPEHDLVFVPTGSPSLDYYGGLRPGDNRDADSIVALRISTGEKVWSFQLVHHDIWDYVTASQPLLFNFRGNVPAVAVTNKTSMIYIFNRLTGKPLLPITEQPVPRSTLPGENNSPTEPFSSLPPLQPLRLSLNDLRGSEADKSFCRTQIEKLRYDGLFTPPSIDGTLLFPAALGGPNWGSSAFDPTTGIMYTRVSVLPYSLQMVPVKSEAAATGNAPASGPSGSVTFSDTGYRPPDLGLGPVDRSSMRGAPFRMLLRAMISPGGAPCGPAPYGRLVATDLNNGQQLWSVAHGQMITGVPGSVGVGGPMVSAGGLLFAASTNDPYLRAYDAKSGRELWKGLLPASANATPMTYAVNGRQYIVIAVGGKSALPEGQSDTVVAFALPEDAH